MSPSLGVVSLNICTGRRNGLPPIRDRAAALGRGVEDSGADVVLLQEVWTRDSLTAIVERLPSYAHVVSAGGLAICSRAPLGPPVFTSFRGARARRGGLLFRARLAAGSRMRGVLAARRAADGVLLATTQLTSNRDGDWSTGNRHHLLQRAQLDLLHAALGEADGTPRVLGGDFNVAAGSALYPRLTGYGAWHDPFAGDPRPTFRAECLPPGATAYRVDYLLVQGFAGPVTRTELLFCGPGLLSDHVAPMVRIGATDR